ncbi:hypothetical protein DH09_11610 [Bacillaceae bacterium JMAK1]|nr:hypothetical protein DH09_11610 [Bacillaceae bacterium JMAK1]
MNKKIIWKNLEAFGYEYFDLRIEKDINAIGTIITTVDDVKPIAMKYCIQLNQNWVTTEVNIEIDNQNRLKIHSDGNGNWFNEDGAPLENLRGAIDVDFSATPFSNTLPINRESWNVGDEKKFEMVYITFPELEVMKVKQSYKYIKTLEGNRYYDYECRGYQTEIRVDRDGFVLDYPNVFQKIY